MAQHSPQAQAASLPTSQPSLWRAHWQQFIALFFWIVLLGSYQWYAWHNHLVPLQALQQIIHLLDSNMFGPLLFIVIYTLRPLILFPATVLTLGAGFVFGPVLGIAYTIVGSNLSALLAFFLGRFLGEGLLNGKNTTGVLQRYTDRLRDHSFETVLLMRFIFLPYDLVNYLCGVLRVNWQAYLLATILGSLPGTIAVALAGSSIHGDLSRGLPHFDPRIFAVSVVLLVVSLLISRIIKRREQGITS